MADMFQPPRAKMHHLPRLPEEAYRNFAVVFWTITLERRATGWLDNSFHATFRELLLHDAAREGLLVPVYVLMPDHLHVVWMGLRQSTDQLRGMRFLRKYLARELAARSTLENVYELQKQAHDSVLRKDERRPSALSAACFYVLDNPRRRGLVAHPREWPHLGALVPGYPFLHPLMEDFWEQFWKLYWLERELLPSEQAPPESL
jgi:putative transposase